MKSNNRIKAGVAAALTSVVCTLVTAPANAAWPDDKLMRIVVPFAAGGSTDLMARKLAEGIGQRLNTRVIVENKAGAGGTVGTAYVAKEPADGYTMLMGTVSTNGSAACIYPSLPYDPVKDFTPLAVVSTIPNVVEVNKNVPANTLPELVELVKENPGEYAFASNGVGTSNHLATELLLAKSGMKMTHVPYRGSGPAMIDLLGGQVDLMLDVVMTSYPHIRDGKLKPLAVTSAKRSPLLPDVPTVAEQGYPGFEAIVWFGIFAPAGLPDDIAAKLGKVLSDTITSDDMANYFKEQGAEASGLTGEPFRNMVRSEVAKWCEVTKAANIQLN